MTREREPEAFETREGDGWAGAGGPVGAAGRMGCGQRLSFQGFFGILVLSDGLAETGGEAIKLLAHV